VASTGLGIVGAFGQHDAQRKAVQEHNARVRQNAIEAGMAASNQFADLGRQFVYEARTTQQEAQKAVLSGRQAIGTALASAGSSGFSGSSLTVGAVMADEQRRIAENEQNLALKLDDQKDAFRSRGRMVEAQARGRINELTPMAEPSGMTLGLNIANAVVGGIGGVSKAFNR
jgi:hypothetical protein